MNSEFNGPPEDPEFAESQFLKSIEELMPVFEGEGVKLVLEPHPDDFIEDGHAAVNMVKGLNKDWISFLYCTPHTFHQGNDAAGIIGAAGSMVTYVHLADTLDHTACNGLRYIVNPPGSTMRVHQHAPWARSTTTRRSARWRRSGSTVTSSCVFGWEGAGSRDQRVPARCRRGADRKAVRCGGGGGCSE